MRITIFAFLIVLTTAVLYSQNFIDPATPAGALPMNVNIGEGWVLDFSDEFNGNAVDPGKWQILHSTKTRAPRPDIGVADWRWLPENVEVRDGNLVFNVVKLSHNSMSCGSINSNGLYETTYGYFEVRMKVGDVKKGTHSAFWLQSNDMSTVTGNAHNGAEIDVFESAWDADFVKCVVHIDGYGKDKQANTIKFDTPGLFADYQVWGFHWTEHFMRIYYNGNPVAHYWEDKWIVRSPEFLWLSNGASFGLQGNQYFIDHPIGHLTETYVDYIRVWKQNPSGNDVNNVFNGNFKGRGSGWTLSNSDMVFRDDYDSIEGVTCRMPGVNQTRNISQRFNLKPGGKYSFQFTGRIHDAVSASGDVPNNMGATLMAEILAGTSSLMSLSTQSFSNHTVSSEVIIPEDVSELLLRISKDKGVAYLDNISLKPVTSTRQKNVEIETQSIIFPNPSNGYFSIRSKNQVSFVEILNMSGQILRRFQVNGYSFSSGSDPDLPPGTYLILVWDEKGNFEKHKHMIF